MSVSFNVAIILDVNRPYDRKVVAGISRFHHENQNWNLYLEDDPLSKIPDFRKWPGDGVIGNLDDPKVCEVVDKLSIPVVGYGGGSLAQVSNADIPYIYTDNRKITQLAFDHLHERGFRQFAYCGIPLTPSHVWERDRRACFLDLCKSGGFGCSLYTGKRLSTRNWTAVQEDLAKWLNSLKKPVGLMASNDGRARHVLEACQLAGVRVPEEIAVIGVDDDEMMCELAYPPLSSVVQGTDRLGYEAAQLLDQMMRGKKVAKKKIMDPVGVTVRQSTDVVAIDDPLVSKALSFCREEACRPAQVDDVAQHCTVSRSLLEKRFKHVMGHTVHEEISKLQINKACELLIHTVLPIKRVSSLCGYATVQYMHSKFKRLKGVSPGQFRKTYKH